MAEAHISFKDVIILKGLSSQIAQLQERFQKMINKYRNSKRDQLKGLAKFMRNQEVKEEDEIIQTDEYIEYQPEDYDSDSDNQE